MAECSRCKVETQLHVNGVPVCPGCDDSATHAQKKSAEGKMATAAMAFSALNSDSGRNLDIDRRAYSEYSVSSVRPERP
jgi:hypothetical protein